MSHKVKSYLKEVFVNSKVDDYTIRFLTAVIDYKLNEENIKENITDVLKDRFIIVWEHQLMESYPELQDVKAEDFKNCVCRILKRNGIEYLVSTTDKLGEFIFIGYIEGSL